VLKHAVGNTQQGTGIFPAGVPHPSSSTGGAAAAAAAVGQLPVTAPMTAGVDPRSRHNSTSVVSSPLAGSYCLDQHHAGSQSSSGDRAGVGSSSKGTSRNGQLLQPLEQKLAHRNVEARVDQVFAAKAAGNMPDGSFNPGLSLQQSTDYEAAREAADLDRRLERGLVSCGLGRSTFVFVCAACLRLPVSWLSPCCHLAPSTLAVVAQQGKVLQEFQW